MAAEATEATTPVKEVRKGKKTNRDASKASGKRASLECAALVDDLPKSSNSNRSKAAAPTVKKVPAGLAGTDGTFTISGTLDDK